LTNYPNSKQTQESLESDFHETTFWANKHFLSVNKEEERRGKNITGKEEEEMGGESHTVLV
jgi:hypothetical protein